MGGGDHIRSAQIQMAERVTLCSRPPNFGGKPRRAENGTCMDALAPARARARARYSRIKKPQDRQINFSVDGGGSGIRTHVTVSRKHAFQACAFSHSATPPHQLSQRRTPFYTKTRAGALSAPSATRPPHQLPADRYVMQAWTAFFKSNGLVFNGCKAMKLQAISCFNMFLFRRLTDYGTKAQNIKMTRHNSFSASGGPKVPGKPT